MDGYLYSPFPLISAKTCVLYELLIDFLGMLDVEFHYKTA
jgi:hypothetical protein